MFDAVEAAKARGIDVVLADTAGRLPTQAHLMEELRKVKRVLGTAAARRAARGPAGARRQHRPERASRRSRRSTPRVGLTGLILTKLDGSAKGGVVAAIAKQHPVPLKFIGVGEGVDDLRPFAAARVRRRPPSEPTPAEARVGAHYARRSSWRAAARPGSAVHRSHRGYRTARPDSLVARHAPRRSGSWLRPNPD